MEYRLINGICYICKYKTVVTDNDGSVASLEEKYKKYIFYNIP